MMLIMLCHHRFSKQFSPVTMTRAFTVYPQRRRCRRQQGTPGLVRREMSFDRAHHDHQDKVPSSFSATSPLLHLPYHINNNNNSKDDIVDKRHIRYAAAPMVAASDYAYRSLCRQYGVDLTFTQMLHVGNLNRKDDTHDTFWKNHVDFWEHSDHNNNDINHHGGSVIATVAQEQLLRGLSSSSSSSSSSLHDNGKDLPKNWHDYTAGPLIVQLAGHEPEAVVHAALRLYDAHPDQITGFDLNCGCPQHIARKGNYGAFFMEADNGIQASRVLRALRQALPTDKVTVSCKCRLPVVKEDEEGEDGNGANQALFASWKERVDRLRGAGIDFLTVHGRNLKENKTQTGPANTAAIRRAVEWLSQSSSHHAPPIPVIANGGVERYSDVQRVFRDTGAAAVMSSEGLLERPDLFQPPDEQDMSTPRQVLERQFQIAYHYLAWARRFPPLPGVLGQQSGSFNVVRGHLFKFLHRYWQEQPDLRDKLSCHTRALCLQDAYDLVDELYQRYDRLSDAALAHQSSSRPEASWYRRHWNAMGVTSTTSPRHTVTKQEETLSVTERKALLQRRIAALRNQRQERTTTLP